MSTFTIRSQNVSATIHNNDFQPILQQNVSDNQHMSVVTMNNINDTSSYRPNACLKRMISDGYTFSTINNSLKNTKNITLNGDGNVNSWGNFDSLYPHGFLIVSLEQSKIGIDASYISFRINNINNNKPYHLQMTDMAAMILSKITSNNTFIAGYTVCNSNDSVVSTQSFNLTNFKTKNYNLINSIDVFIPTNGYIEFRITCTSLSSLVNTYLLLSFTGITVSKPNITFTNSSLTASFDSTTSLIINVDHDVKGNTLNGSLISLYLLDSVNQLNTSPIQIINGVAKYQLVSSLLTTSTTAYTIYASYIQDQIYPNYLSTKSSNLSLTVVALQLVSVITVKPVLSFRDTLVIVSSLQNELSINGKSNVYITYNGNRINQLDQTIIYPEQYIASIGDNDGEILLMPGIYTIHVNFEPDDTINFLNSSYISKTFIVDEFKMVVTSDKNTVSYQDSVTFTITTESGGISFDKGGSGMLILHDNVSFNPYAQFPIGAFGTVVVNPSDPTDNLLPGSFLMSVSSLDGCNTYTDPTGFFNDPITGFYTYIVNKSAYIELTITSQPFTLTLNPPDYTNHVENGYDSNNFNYSYNQSFILTGTLLCGVTQPIASILTQVEPIIYNQLIYPYSITISSNTLFGQFMIDNTTDRNMTHFYLNNGYGTTFNIMDTSSYTDILGNNVTTVDIYGNFSSNININTGNMDLLNYVLNGSVYTSTSYSISDLSSINVNLPIPVYIYNGEIQIHISFIDIDKYSYQLYYEYFDNRTIVFNGHIRLDSGIVNGLITTYNVISFKDTVNNVELLTTPGFLGSDNVLIDDDGFVVIPNGIAVKSFNVSTYRNFNLKSIPIILTDTIVLNKRNILFKRENIIGLNPLTMRPYSVTLNYNNQQQPPTISVTITTENTFNGIFNITQLSSVDETDFMYNGNLITKTTLVYKVTEFRNDDGYVISTDLVFPDSDNLLTYTTYSSPDETIIDFPQSNIKIVNGISLPASFLDSYLNYYFTDYVNNTPCAIFYDSPKQQIYVFTNNANANEMLNVNFNKDGSNDSPNINNNLGFTTTTTIDQPSGTGFIKNFILTRVDDQTVLPINVYNGVTLDDYGNFTLTIDSPEAIGTTLTSGLKNYSLAWVPPPFNPVLFTLTNTSSFTVNAIKGFNNLAIAFYDYITTMTFEEISTIECSAYTAYEVVDGTQAPVFGMYTLYHSLVDSNDYSVYGVPIYADTNSNVIFNFTTDTTDQTNIADHSFYFTFTATDINHVIDQTYIIQQSDSITLSVTQVLTNFGVTFEEDSIGITDFNININTILTIHVSNLQTQTEVYNDIKPVIKHTIPGSLLIQYSNSQSDDERINLFMISVDDSVTIDWYTEKFSVLSKYIPISTTYFIITFTPTDAVHFASSTFYQNVNISSNNLLNQLEYTFTQTSYSYWDELKFNIKISPNVDGFGEFIPILGTLTITNEENQIFYIDSYSVQTDQLQTISTGLNAYDLQYYVDSVNQLTVKFVPFGSYSYYPYITNVFPITIIQQKIRSVTISSNRDFYSYDQLMDLDFTSSDVFLINGSVTFTLEKLGSGIVTELSNDVKTINNVSLSKSTGNTSLTFRNPLHFESNSTTIVISAIFVSTDLNYTDGITTVVTKTITIVKSNVKMVSLNITVNNQTTLVDEHSNIFVDGITIVKGGGILIDGYLKNVDAINQDENVKSGVVNIYTKNEVDYNDTYVYSEFNELGSMTVDENGHFTNANNIFIPSTSYEFYLSYQNTNDYVITDFIYDGIYVPIPGNFYINVINTPYNITMSYQQNEYIDYHDGQFEFNITMDFPITSELSSLIDSQRISNYKVGKFVVTIADLDDNLNVVYSNELEPILGSNGTTGLFQIGHPRTFVLSNGTIGLKVGNYQFTSSFEGINGSYDAQESININSGDKYINFTIVKTVPTIEISLSKNNIFYREKSTLSMKVQTPTSINSDYYVYNDLIGTSTISFISITDDNIEHETTFNTTNWQLGDVSGSGTVSVKTIVNIQNLKTVLLPIIPVRMDSDQYFPTVNRVKLSFEPDDTINYTSSSILIPITINRYKPVLSSITFTSSDGTTNTNVNDVRQYNNGVINYDEQFNINVFLQRFDKSPSVDYAGIIGQIYYTYKNIDPKAGTQAFNYTQMINSSSSYSTNSQYVDYVTTILKQEVLVDKIDTYVNGTVYQGFKNAQFILTVQFIPNDMINYELSAPLEKPFALYIANSTGTIDLSISNANINHKLQLTYNVTKTVTLNADIHFDTDVNKTYGVLGFFYDSIDTEHLLLPFNNSSFFEGFTSVTNNGIYNYQISKI